jgi:hypothetical protein
MQSAFSVWMQCVGQRGRTFDQQMSVDMAKMILDDIPLPSREQHERVMLE